MIEWLTSCLVLLLFETLMETKKKWASCFCQSSADDKTTWKRSLEKLSLTNTKHKKQLNTESVLLKYSLKVKITHAKRGKESDIEQLSTRMIVGSDI